MLVEEIMVYCDGNEIIDLTPLETKLLSILLIDKSKKATLDELVEKIYKENKKTYKKYNAISQIISRLNKKVNKYFTVSNKRSLGVYYIK